MKQKAYIPIDTIEAFYLALSSMAPASTPQQIIADLKQQKYKPVYFFQGTEPYYIDWLVAYIAKHVVPTAEKSLNLSILYGKQHTMQHIMIKARQFPMLGTRQVIIIKEAQELQDLQKVASQKLLLDYLMQPNPHTLLVFAYKYKTLDKRNALTKTLAEKGVLLTTKPLYQSEMPNWISSYLQEFGYNISPKAALTLQTMIGNNLQILANELQKIIINLPQDIPISEKTVLDHVGMSRAFNLFELQQALSTKSTDKVCHIAQYLAKNPKKHPLLKTISFLATFFTKLLQLHHNPSTDPKLVASQLQIHPYLAKTHIKALSQYTLAQTIQNIHHLHQADLQAKGIDHPPLSEASILKELTAKLITDAPAQTAYTTNPLNKKKAIFCHNQ